VGVRGAGGRPRWSGGVLGSSWGSWQAVTPMRSPGREASVKSRHRDVAKSDLRDDQVGELPHLARIVDEDAGNVTLSGPGRPFSGSKSRARNALRDLGPL